MCWTGRYDGRVGKQLSATSSSARAYGVHCTEAPTNFDIKQVNLSYYTSYQQLRLLKLFTLSRGRVYRSLKHRNTSWAWFPLAVEHLTKTEPRKELELYVDLDQPSLLPGREIAKG
jgi:hypothetical protein